MNLLFCFLLVLIILTYGNSKHIKLSVQKYQYPLELHPIQSLEHKDEIVRVRFNPISIAERKRKDDLMRSQSNSSDDKDVNLYANMIEYYVTLAIGNPNQLQNVQVDTGSALLAVPLDGCSTCCSSNYDPSQSSSSEIIKCKSDKCSSKVCYENTNDCSFNISYGDSSNIRGILITDNLGFQLEDGNFTSTTVTFGGIRFEYPSCNFQASPVTGILGMSYGDSMTVSLIQIVLNERKCVPNCVKTTFDAFVDNGIFENIFAMSLGQYDDDPNTPNGIQTLSFSFSDEKKGVLTLGGDGLEDYNETVHYTPVKEESYYVVGVYDIQLGNYSIREPAPQYKITIVDSGTTFLVLPKPQVINFVKVFQTYYCDLPFVCGSPNIFEDGYCLNDSSYTIEKLKMFPNLTFTFEDLQVTLTPLDYLEQFDLNGEIVHCLGIQTGEEDSITILGDTFMKAFHIVFDRKNARLGFIGKPGTVVPFQMNFHADDSSFYLTYMMALGCGGVLLFGTLFGVVCGNLVVRYRNRAIKNYSSRESQEPFIVHGKKYRPKTTK